MPTGASSPSLPLVSEFSSPFSFQSPVDSAGSMAIANSLAVEQALSELNQHPSFSLPAAGVASHSPLSSPVSSPPHSPPSLPPSPPPPPFQHAQLFSITVGNKAISFATLNAKFLTAAVNAGRVAELEILLAQLKHPDVVVVTELSGAAGCPVREILSESDLLKFYGAVWTNRSLSRDGGAALSGKNVGGGVLMLYHNRLRASVTEVSFSVPDADRPLLDGHLRVWQLNPCASPSSFGSLRFPLIVTAVYLPPTGNWASLVRDAVLSAIEESESAVLHLRRTRGAAHMVLGHFNAQLGAYSAELTLSNPTRAASIASQSPPPRGRRGFLESQHGQLTLRSAHCKAAAASDSVGKRLLRIMLDASMCPTSGVMSFAAPTSLQSCLKCAAACRCGRGKLRNINDLLFVDSDSVVDALLAPRLLGKRLLKLSSRFIKWSPKIDHAVTFGHVCFSVPSEFRSLGVSAPPSSSSLPLSSISHHQQVKRTRLPDDQQTRMEVEFTTARLLNGDSNFTSRALSASDIDSIAEKLTSATLQASAKAISLHPPPPLLPPDSLVGGHSFRKKVRVAHLNCKAAARRIRSSHGDAAQRRSAWRFYDRCTNTLRQLRRHRTWGRRLQLGRLLQRASLSAKKLFWRTLKRLSRDHGAPDGDQLKLLDRLHDSDGNVVSIDPAVIRTKILEYRAGVFSLRRDFSEPVLSGIHADLITLSAVNQRVLASHSDILPSSAAALSAADPVAVWRGQTVPAHPSPSVSSHSVASLAKFDAVNSQFSSLCTNTCSDQFTLSELSVVLRNLDDVAPGLDGVAVASLKRLDQDALSSLLNFYNLIWRCGVVPQSWNFVRIVQIFKGKGADAYCPDNYRGLGIGCAFEKIYHLLLMRRLDTFLTKTNALHWSQGGFLQMRSTHEQQFTLIETVKAALQSRGADPVFLGFIDIEKAYDSVIHAKLWARCIELGIGGCFLAALQAIYANKKAVLDINGELLGEQDIEQGVLQGSPLSPLLFNIMLDLILRELDTVCANINSVSPNSAGLPLMSELLCSLFFADDGVLLARSRDSMQLLLDALFDALDRIGLRLSARKTKVLLVPGLRIKPEKYAECKQSAISAGGFSAGGHEVALVDSFVYLGTKLHWTWTLHEAWDYALSRVRRASYLLRQSGFQNHGAPMIFQWRLACSVALSYIDHIIVLSGVLGYSSQIEAADKEINLILRTIVGAPLLTDGLALRLEFGISSTDLRGRALMLRFFTKLSNAPKSSTHFQALMLSRLLCGDLPRESMNSGFPFCLSPPTLRPFLWHCIQAAALMDFDASVSPLLPTFYISSIHLRPSAALVSVQRRLVGDEVWRDVALGTTDVAGQELRLVSTSKSDHTFSVNYSTGQLETDWSVPSGLSIDEAHLTWYPSKRVACNASLRRRANVWRAHHELPPLTNGWASNDSALRDFVALKTSCATEPYVHSFDVTAARRFALGRLGHWGDEYTFRRKPRNASGSNPALPRIPAHSRQCYLARDGVESLAHLLTSCSHPDLVELRAGVREAISSIASAASHFEACPPPPNLNDKIVFYTLLMGCAHPGNVFHNTSATVTRSVSASNPSMRLDAATMRPACDWFRFLSGQWIGNLRGAERTELSDLGCRLVNLISSHSRRLYSLRRKLLATVSGFQSRCLDPIPEH